MCCHQLCLMIYCSHVQHSHQMVWNVVLLLCGHPVVEQYVVLLLCGHLMLEQYVVWTPSAGTICCPTVVWTPDAGTICCPTVVWTPNAGTPEGAVPSNTGVPPPTPWPPCPAEAVNTPSGWPPAGVETLSTFPVITKYKWTDILGLKCICQPWLSYDSYTTINFYWLQIL